MKKLLLHIGLHKTASTFLQELIFKKICIDYNLKSNLNDQKLSNEINDKIALFRNNFGCLKSLSMIGIDYGVISNESLCGPRSDPAYFQFFRDLNYQLFGEKAHVLIVIRKPSDFLRSIYLQSIHKGEIIKIEDFFLKNKDYKNIDKEKLRKKSTWLLEDFSYDHLINLYKQKFKNVTICKFEEVFDLNFLNKILELDDTYISNLKQKNSKTVLNKSFSGSAVKLSFFLEKNLNKFGMSLLKKDSISNYTSHNKFIKLIKNNITYKKIISNIYDKIIPYKQYDIDYSKLNFFDIDKADKDYKNLSC